MEPDLEEATVVLIQTNNTLKKIIIGIDGYSSCGKSTLAKALAKALHYTYIDSGAMYRAVTFYFLEQKIALEDTVSINTALQEIEIRFEMSNGHCQTLLNGKDVEEEIRKMYVANWVSPVAAISAVRRAMVQQQQAMGKDKGIVMDGRDIGTVVFPDAELKLFLTASPDVRAQRRFLELKTKGLEPAIEQVRNNLRERDRIDSTRTDSPLMQAQDAVLLDNTNLSPEEQFEMTLALAKLRMQE